jgi:coproporphyrinogen III oxidase-like Fe-S oxidoreductase
MGMVCCRIGDWIFYNLHSEPGVNADQVWAEDLTQARRLAVSHFFAYGLSILGWIFAVNR